MHGRDEDCVLCLLLYCCALSSARAVRAIAQQQTAGHVQALAVCIRQTVVRTGAVLACNSCVLTCRKMSVELLSCSARIWMERQVCSCCKVLHPAAVPPGRQFHAFKRRC
jgi:hypothetical protein